MMSEASFASLGPTLLARKGGAKPAMRPQLTPLPDNLTEMAALADEQLEDLGWNDMGSDGDEDGLTQSSGPLLSNKASVARTVDGGADIVPISVHAHPAAANEDAELAPSIPNDPVVRNEQKRLASEVLASAVQAVNESKSTQKTKSKAKPGRRAAFTLRLDTDRHLKLRLAATMQGVSAQSLVTEALDAMLERIDELDTLVERMKRD